MKIFLQSVAGILSIVLLFTAPAGAGTISGWIADRFADDILDGAAKHPAGAQATLRIAIKPFTADMTPISVRVANELNTELLAALMRKSDGRHVFVAREALKPLARDISQRALPGPRDPVETLLENSRADILVIGKIRRSRGDIILSYKAVQTTNGAVLASTQSQRFAVRDADLPDSGLAFDEALAAAARYLVQRVDGPDAIQVGKIHYRNDAESTPFASYLRDRMADELRRSLTGVLTATEIPVTKDADSKAVDAGTYRLIGNYWPLGEAVELSLSLRGQDGIAVTWREKIRRNTIPAALALGPESHTVPNPRLTATAPRSKAPRQPRFGYVQGLETVAEAQRLLQSLGYDPGPVDGFLNAQTRQAIMAFQRNNGFGPDGRMTRALVSELRTSADRH